MLKITERRDIKGGAMTYGERLQMAQILRNTERSEFDRVADIIECLHGERPNDIETYMLANYAMDCADAVVEWMKREQRECTIDPNPEAVQAGIGAFSKAVGEMGTVVSMAERFNLIPLARVYELPYLDVFAIWKTDAESAKFERRLAKVRERKMKQSHRKR